MRYILKKLLSLGVSLTNIVITALAVVMVLYSGLVLYDTVYTDRTAFISSDLSQYRPELTEEEPGFDEMLEINPDVQGWITIRDTNIDYPVVQGEDDIEYAMKDVYGKSSLTGSIYLTVINNSEFTDSFNLVYGHHMENGAMFGDIAKYADEDFFFSHQDGILVTRRGVYDLKIFARLSADAYDDGIYMAGDQPYSAFPDFLYYVKDLSVQWDPSTDIEEITKNIQTYIAARDKNIRENGRFVFKKMPEDAVKKGMQLIAFSTCADATTNGRQLLVATMKLRTDPLPDYYLKEDKAGNLSAWGHGEVGHWGLLNGICLVMILMILLPGIRIPTKYSAVWRRLFSRKDLKDKNFNLWIQVIGILIEIAIALFSVFLFIWTENPTKPMVIVDEWTLGMIGLFAIMLAVDILVIGKCWKGNNIKEDKVR